MTLRDWKIFCWALMHSPQTCEIEIFFLNLTFERFGYNNEIFNLNLSIHLPPKILIHIPYQTRNLYELKVEGAETEIDDIPF